MVDATDRRQISYFRFNSLKFQSHCNNSYNFSFYLKENTTRLLYRDKLMNDV
jgi:hypothetical protein